MVKNNKGFTLTSLSVAVIILMIVTSIMVFNSQSHVEMEKLNEYTGINLAKGASEKVDNQLKELLKTHDEKYLLDIAKLDFKTYQKNIN